MTEMERLRNQCLDCTACPLCRERIGAVFGVGNIHADIVFVGEGPGQQEDLSGEPFVGAAGKLLDEMLNIIDLNRYNCYITNIVKCRPPQNRDPLPEERDACMIWLRRQFALLHPRIVVCLGRIAAQKLIRPDFSVTKEHGRWEEKNGTLFTATWHPAALLRYPENKTTSFGDYIEIRNKAHLICPEFFEQNS